MNTRITHFRHFALCPKISTPFTAQMVRALIGNSTATITPPPPTLTSSLLYKTSQPSRFFTLLLAIGLMMVGVGSASGATRIASVTAAWNSTTTWGGNAIPTSSDNVIINSGIKVTIPSNYSAVCSTIDFTTGNSGAASITFTDATSTLTTGVVTIQQQGSGGSTNTIAVGAGSFTCSSITMSATTSSSRFSQITISTGTINVSGNINSAGTASRITFSGAGMLNAGGTFMGGTTGTFTPSTGTVNYNGSAQTIGAYTYNNLTLSGSGTKTIASNLTVNGNLSISGSAIAGLANGTTSTANTLTLGGGGADSGSWGSSNSSASNKNDTYFLSGNSGILNVSAATGTKPAVTTQAATSVATTTATGNGTISNFGTSTPTQYGVVWNTSTGPTVALSTKTTQGTPSTTGAFTSTVTGLSPGTTYYLRAYATSIAGTTYGNEVTFTTAAIAPTVTTQAVTSITATTATGNGNITSLGVPNPTAYGVCWNTTGSPTTANSKTNQGSASTTGAFTSSMTGLTANTTYYVCAYATNTAGTVYGNVVTFTTAGIAPTVTTQAATSVTTTTATGNGNITSLGVPNPTAYGVCWNTTGSPTTANSNTNQGSISTTGAFTSSMTGLTANTTYYVCAYATNTAGTVYGNVVTFTTAGIAPTVTTQAATSVTTTTATGNGNITSLGVPNPTAYGVCWNTTGSPTTANSNTNQGSISTTGAFTSSMTGLTANTTYYVCAYATNTAGTVYGNVVTFTTTAIAPTVTTQAATDISGTSATCNGTITALGSPNPTAYGFCWNTTGTPSTSDNTVNISTTPATGSFSNSISGLTFGTKYYVRAYATNSAGTSYGNEINFTYLPIVYVRMSGRGTKDGSSWTNAAATVQEAVETANSMSPKAQVWVAAGDYYRNDTYFNASTGIPGYQKYTTTTGWLWQDWANTFLMREGVNVYGGFREYSNADNTDGNGKSADMQNDRLLLSDDTHYKTILHGGSDQRVLGPLYTYIWTPNYQGYYTAGLRTGFTTSTTWDGFTLTDGVLSTNNVTTAPGNSYRDESAGAGAFIIKNAILSNCVIENNTASATKADGGGALMFAGGTFQNCIIRHNTAYDDGTGNCTGGGIRMVYGGAKVINCLIYDNKAERGGGINLSLIVDQNGISLGSNYVPDQIINCTFANNIEGTSTASGIRIKYALGNTYSSGYSDDYDDNLTIRAYLYNNAIWDALISANNKKSSGSTLYYPAFIENYDGINSTYSPQKNANSTSDASGVMGSKTVILSTQGTNSGSNAPYFVNPTATEPADYRLQGVFSKLCNIGALSTDGLTGTPNLPITDLRGLYRKSSSGSRPDIGCYELTSRVFCVNNSAAGKLDETCRGRNWNYPYSNLQFALDQYDQYDFPQVWVATGNGSFSPTKNVTGVTVADATATFTLKTNLSLYGGFTGTQSTEFPNNYNELFSKPNLRSNFITNKIILSSPIATSIVNYNPAAPERFLFGVGSTPYWKGATIDGFTISGTVAGGTAVALPDSAILRNCKIINNLGNGLSMGTATAATNVLITENGGVGATLRGTNAALTNATIANNTSFAIGGTGTAALTSSIIWGNSANFDALADTARITATYTALSTASASNDIPANKWVTFASGTGNRDIYQRSPNFKTRKGNYELLQISPCLDAGDASKALTIDVNGLPRTYGGKVDMGALQKQSGDGMYVSGSGIISNFRASGSPVLTDLAGKEVLINPGATLALSSTIIQPKTLMIQDDNTIAAPIITGTSFTADSILYVRTLIKKRADNTTGLSTFFGLPFTSVTLDKIDGFKIENGIRIMRYDEPTRAANGPNKSAWKAQSTTDALTPGIGYALTTNTKVPDKPWSMTAIIPAAKGSTLTDVNNIINTLSYTATGTQAWNEKGWNLIANPTAQTVAFNTTLPYWPNNKTSIWGQIYTYTPKTDSYTPIPLYTNMRISAYSACFVLTTASTNTANFQALAGGDTPLRVSRRNSVAAIEASALPDLFRLNIKKDSIENNTYVMFHDSAHVEAVAIEDGPSLWGTGNTLQMSTYATGSSLPLSVNRLPFTGNVVEMPLTVKIPTAGTYTFSLPENDNVTLVTLVEADGATHNLNENTYTLTADAVTTLSYTLRFVRRNVVTDQKNILQESGITIYQENGKAVITSTDALQQVKLYGINGQLIQAVNNGNTRILLDLPAAGVYLVKATTTEKTATKKLVYK